MWLCHTCRGCNVSWLQRYSLHEGSHMRTTETLRRRVVDHLMDAMVVVLCKMSGVIMRTKCKDDRG